MDRGLLIALEGIDGAGTTTQAQLLTECLSHRGARSHLACEPSPGLIGQLLRTVLKGQTPWPMDAAAVALLFAADRVDHFQHEVRPRLQAGVHVITDRSVYSSLAYQSVEQDPAWIEAINRLAPEPDLVVYVRVDPGLARQRREARGGSPERFDDLPMQARVSARYDALLGSSTSAGSWVLSPVGSGWIRSNPQGSTAGAASRLPVVAVVDGSLTAQEIHRQLCGLVEEVALRQGT